MIGRLLTAEAAFDAELAPYRVRADRIMVAMNCFLMAVCIGMAPLYATFTAAAAIGLPTLFMAVWLLRRHPGTLATRLFMASSFMIFTGLIIHQSAGAIEGHFSAFGLIGVLLYYRDWRTIVVATLVIYLHHLIFGYAQTLGVPVYVFNNDRFWTKFVIHVAYFLPFVSMMAYLSVWLRREGHADQHVIALAERIARGENVDDDAMLANEEKAPLIAAVLQMKNSLLEHQQHLEEMVAARTRDLLEAKDAAESANRAKTAFLANMSHELRTPIHGVMGMIQLAMRRTSDPEGVNLLEKAKLSSERLLHVLNDILDLTKIESERLVLESIPFDLGQSVANVTDTLSPLAVDKGLRLSSEIPPELASTPMRGDPLRLNQILLNLVGNAIKFTEKGEITLRISALDDDANTLRVRFEIIDTGIGITSEAITRLFRSFEQADNSMTRRYGGSGLGLAICKRLVQTMGGEIGVLSDPGRGSTFWLTIPLTKREGDGARPAVAFPDPMAEHRLLTEFSEARILLVDDDPVAQDVARHLLEEMDLAVDIAGNGSEGVALARKNTYDLILMDMQMPLMNGLEATQAIRADSRNQSTPILAMTANAFHEDRQACLAAGMNDHLAKPVTPTILFETLLTWLEKSRG